MSRFRPAVIAASAAFILGAAPLQAGQPTYHLLHKFTGGSDGGNPQGALAVDRNGNIYGTTNTGGAYHYGTVFRVSRNGTFAVLHSFSGGNDGGNPGAGVVADLDGSLYGTATYGGASDHGLVYKLSADGTLTSLHDFSGNDGAYPYGNLLLDAQGNLYGTASGGGAYDGGTAFRLTRDGGFTTLHSFGAGKDGKTPLSGLVIDDHGNLYGSAPAGGAYGSGAVFTLRRDGREKVLYAFTGQGDGGPPYGAVIRDGLGNLYGTTFAGGKNGDGTAYKLATSGALTVIHSFEEDEGEYLYAGLAPGRNGTLFGATVYGGAGGGGVVFRLKPDGRERVLHSFSSGAGSYSTPVFDEKGRLYGTTFRGSNDQGTVWEITP